MKDFAKLEIFILDQINKYKSIWNRLLGKYQNYRQDNEFEEDTLPYLEDLNFYKGIIEGLKISLKKLQELE